MNESARWVPLAFIQEKWEAASEVLVNNDRQVGHDEEEDRDQAGRHSEAGQPDPQFSPERVVFSGGRFLFHVFSRWGNHPIQPWLAPVVKRLISAKKFTGAVPLYWRQRTGKLFGAT